MPTHPTRDKAVSDQIVAALEQGNRPWIRPWSPPLPATGGPAAPMNGTTGRQYWGGINTLLLGMWPLPSMSGDPRKCGYKQAAERGWQVGNGERSTGIFFYKQLEVRAEGVPATGDDRRAARMIPMLRWFNAFYASWTDGIPAHVALTIEEAPWRRPEAAEEGFQIRGGACPAWWDNACYSRSTDQIKLPLTIRSRALLNGRLNRILKIMRGSGEYAREKLRVKLASVFIDVEAGLACDIPNQAD